MSRENVEVVRAALDAWNAGDMDRLRGCLDPDIVVRLPEGWPEPGPFVGLDAVMLEWEQARDVWETDTLEPTTELIDAGEQVVLRFVWRGAAPSLPDSQLEFTAVYTVRGGKLLAQESFWDHGAALESVGLEQ